MPDEKVGIKAGITAKLQTVDEKGKVKKTTFFYPDLGVSVVAANAEEARALAEEKAAKIEKKIKQG